MSENLNPYHNIVLTDEWIRKLFFYDGLGMLGTAARQLTQENSRQIKTTAGMLSHAVNSRLQGLRMEDVGTLGAQQLLRRNAQEYTRTPQNKGVVKANYAGTMMALVLRELSQRGRVSYESFSPRATMPNDAISKVETPWTFHEHPQNILLQIHRLNQQLTHLMRNTGIVASRPVDALKVGHFLSMAADMLGRR